MFRLQLDRSALQDQADLIRVSRESHGYRKSACGRQNANALFVFFVHAHVSIRANRTDAFAKLYPPAPPSSTEDPQNSRLRQRSVPGICAHARRAPVHTLTGSPQQHWHTPPCAISDNHCASARRLWVSYCSSRNAPLITMGVQQRDDIGSLGFLVVVLDDPCPYPYRVERPRL